MKKENEKMKKAKKLQKENYFEKWKFMKRVLKKRDKKVKVKREEFLLWKKVKKVKNKRHEEQLREHKQRKIDG